LSLEDHSPIDEKLASQDFPSINDELMTKSMILKSSSIDNSLKENCPIHGYKSSDIESAHSNVQTVSLSKKEPLFGGFDSSSSPLASREI
jgi:hypothetical protein